MYDDSMKFNLLDIILMILAVRGGYAGIRRGIFGELVLSAGVFTALILAVFFNESTTYFFLSKMPWEIKIAPQTSAWLIIAAGILISFLLAKLIQKLSHWIFQSRLDQILGCFFGLGRALALSGTLLLFFIVRHQDFVIKHVEESLIGTFATQRLHEVYDRLSEKLTPETVAQIEEEMEGSPEDQSQEGSAQDLEPQEIEPAPSSSGPSSE